MKQIWIILVFVVCPVLCQTKKPHIVTIFIDDLGWNDVSFHGSNQIQTPNIDALAYSGMILNRHYVLPSCTPSRSALLTGSYPIRTGLQGYPLKGGENRYLPLAFKIKPAYFKNLGYRTHMVGKWHLGYQTYNHVPNHRGFDSFFGYYNGYVDYYHYYYNQTLADLKSSYDGYDLHWNDDVHWTNERVYATRIFTEQARQVIKQHNTSEPLYLYMSHLATHTGTDERMGMESPRDTDVNKTYSYIRDYGRRVFAGCLEELDKSVGILVEELSEKKMLENSIILVMSDNGGHTVSVDMPPNWSSNWPLAGTKFTMYEGGVRGVALIWSPLLPKGFVNEGFLHITDWLPTLYSAAGGDVKDLGLIDGVDQWEQLKNVKTVKRNHILLNIDEKVNTEGIIINDRWKVIKGGFPGYSNYDYHWGKEENSSPSPEYNLQEISSSKTGKAIRKIQHYEDILFSKRMNALRDKATLRCTPPDHGIPHREGYVDQKYEYRCPDFCIFDLSNDPCELVNVKNNEILKIGKRLLNEFKQQLVPQKKSWVDAKSNPAHFGGAWMPWDFQTCLKSKAKEFPNQYINVSLLITLTWYSLRKRRNNFFIN